MHIVGDQPVGADHHVDLAVGQFLQRFLGLLGRLESRQHLDADRPVGEAVGEVAVMLFGEQGRRHQHCDLATGLRGDESGAQGDLGLAEANVAADHAVHRFGLDQVAEYRFDRRHLVRGFLERKTGGELLVKPTIDLDRLGHASAALGVQLQQFGGDVAHLLGGAFLGFFPGIAAERMQRRVFRCATRVTRNQVEARHRYVELVAAGVLDGQELAGRAADVEHDQAAITTDAVVVVHHRRAFGQFAEVADDRFRIALRLATAPFLARALAIQLALGQHGQRRVAEREAIRQCRHCDRPAQVASAERLPVVDRLRSDVGARQQFDQCLAAPGRIRRQQYAARINGEEGLQFGRRFFTLAQHGKRRRRHRAGIDRILVRADKHPFAPVQALAQIVRRQVQLAWRQQRALQIVATLGVAFAGRGKELLGGRDRTVFQHQQRVLRQIVEQCRRGLEEQRQVVLDAGRRAAVLQVLVQRRAPHVEVEALADGLAHAALIGFVEGELARRK